MSDHRNMRWFKILEWNQSDSNVFEHLYISNDDEPNAFSGKYIVLSTGYKCEWGLLQKRAPKIVEIVVENQPLVITTRTIEFSKRIYGVYNGTAISITPLECGGYYSFKVPTDITGGYVGLTGLPETVGFMDITHGLHFSEGKVSVVESGNVRTTPVAYATSDIFIILRTLGGDVFYCKDDGTGPYTYAGLTDPPGDVFYASEEISDTTVVLKGALLEGGDRVIGMDGPHDIVPCTGPDNSPGAIDSRMMLTAFIAEDEFSYINAVDIVGAVAVTPEEPFEGSVIDSPFIVEAYITGLDGWDNTINATFQYLEPLVIGDFAVDDDTGVILGNGIVPIASFAGGGTDSGYCVVRLPRLINIANGHIHAKLYMSADFSGNVPIDAPFGYPTAVIIPFEENSIIDGVLPYMAAFLSDIEDRFLVVLDWPTANLYGANVVLPPTPGTKVLVMNMETRAMSEFDILATSCAGTIDNVYIFTANGLFKLVDEVVDTDAFVARIQTGQMDFGTPIGKRCASLTIITPMEDDPLVYITDDAETEYPAAPRQGAPGKFSRMYNAPRGVFATRMGIAVEGEKLDLTDIEVEVTKSATR